MRFNATIKPVGDSCNMRCTYCFYRSAKGAHPGSVMSEAILRRTLENLFQEHAEGDISITWQGGEPTLAGLTFFRNAFRLSHQLARKDQRVHHAFQTNGLLLDRDWAKFFRDESVLVGLSCDGPAHLHDQTRVLAQGRSSFSEIQRAWELLASESVDRNVLCTVNAFNVDHAEEVYHFFREAWGATHLQFIPLVRPLKAMSPSGGDYAKRLGDFLVSIYETWSKQDRGFVSIQLFEAAFARFLGRPSLCVFMPECGECPIVEWDGSIRFCDHFSGDAFRVERYADLRSMGRAKAWVSESCLTCQVFDYCRGACPAGRPVSPDGAEVGTHWLCEAWKRLFERIDADLMGRSLMPQRSVCSSTS